MSRGERRASANPYAYNSMWRSTSARGSLWARCIARKAWRCAKQRDRGSPHSFLPSSHHHSPQGIGQGPEGVPRAGTARAAPGRGPPGAVARPRTGAGLLRSCLPAPPTDPRQRCSGTTGHPAATQLPACGRRARVGRRRRGGDTRRGTSGRRAHLGWGGCLRGESRGAGYPCVRTAAVAGAAHPRRPTRGGGGGGCAHRGPSAQRPRSRPCSHHKGGDGGVGARAAAGLAVVRGGGGRGGGSRVGAVGRFAAADHKATARRAHRSSAPHASLAGAGLGERAGCQRHRGRCGRGRPGEGAKSRSRAGAHVLPGELPRSHQPRPAPPPGPCSGRSGGGGSSSGAARERGGQPCTRLERTRR